MRRTSPSAHPDYRRNDHLKRRYGITSEDYDRMLKEQGGCCKICGSDEPMHRTKYFTVDHCHETGKVRGLLCHPCNVMLGQAQDNINTLEKAIDYLKEHA